MISGPSMFCVCEHNLNDHPSESGRPCGVHGCPCTQFVWAKRVQAKKVAPPRAAESAAT